MGARTIATFYDVSYKKFPEAYPAGVAEGFDRWVHKALGFVDRVVTLSHKAKEDLVAAYGLDERRVRVVYPSADFLNGSRPALAVDRTGPPFMLFVGEIGPRKNLINLLRAFARIGTRIPHSLVVVGPPGPLPGYAATVRDEVSRLGLGSRARFTGWLPETELAALYSAATAVLLPSLDEGFGYPLLDAMAHGKPVLTSNCASMPEVVEDAAILVNPLSVEEISDGLVTLATDDVLRSRLSEAGLGRVKQFTEEEMVREFWNLYSTLGV
jgi:glycosyltransferase involved in cell wall biosynthesis